MGANTYRLMYGFAAGEMPAGTDEFSADEEASVGGLTGASKVVFVSGQVAFDKEGKLVGPGDLKAQILQFDRLIMTWHRSNETSKRLDDIPGVGPALATALVASVADPKTFRSGRNFSAVKSGRLR